LPWQKKFQFKIIMGKVKQSPADNLDMLKDLYDRGFMPREEYESRRVSILNEPIVWATEPCIEYTAPPVAFNFPQRGESMEILDTIMDPIGMEYPDFLGYDANLPATCDSMEVENTIFTSVDSRIPISSAGHELNAMQLSSEMSYQDKTDLAKKIATLGNKAILRGILNIVSQEEPNLLIQEHEEWTFELDKLSAPTLEKIRFYVDQMEQQAKLESTACISACHLAAASPAAADTEDCVHRRSPRGTSSGNSSPRSCSEMETELPATRKRKNYLRKSAEDLRGDAPKKIKQEPICDDVECAESVVTSCQKEGKSSPRSTKKGFTVSVTIIDTRMAKDEDGVFHCPECDMTFSDSSNMNKHLRTHTAEKPFVCEECGKAFTHSNTLKDHMNIHQKKKPYVCPYEECGKSFSNGSNLNRHLRVHTGEKPYVCTHCDKQFSQSSNMKVHLRTHFK
jgi:DNA-directed RNA polymerase subunit RPC12/RpoP